jgi:hypothetical protein
MALCNFFVEAIDREFTWLEIMRAFVSIYRNVLEIVLYISEIHTLNSSNDKFLVFEAFGIFWDLLLLNRAFLPSY